MRRILTPLLLALTLSALALGQTSSKGVVNTEALGPGQPVPAGSTFEGSVTLSIRPGYHINAQKPSEEYLIGTALKLTPTAGISVVKMAYPTARTEKFSFSETPLAVYEGAAKITVTFKVDGSAAAGQQTIPGKVTFQACNDRQCLPPSTVDVIIPVEVAASAAGAPAGPTENTNAEKQSLTLTGAPPDARVSIDGREVGRANSQGRYIARDLKPGRHRVRVESEGFKPWEQSVDLSGAQPQFLTVSLETDTPAITVPAPDAAPVPAPAPEAPQPAAPAAAQPEPPPRSNTILYVVGAVVALALVGVGAYAATRARPRA